jgi:translation initiation factor SUI1
MSLDLGQDFSTGAENMLSSKRLYIRMQNRGGRKKITIVHGLECITSEQVNKLKKVISTTNGCSGTFKIDDEFGEHLKFSGDQRESIVAFLIANRFIERDNIVFMGA